MSEDDGQPKASVSVSPDQQSLAIGRGGQNVRLAAKLTACKIDIVSVGGKKEEEENKEVEVEIAPNVSEGTEEQK